MNFLLVIDSNFGRFSYLPFWRYWRLKLENGLFYHPLVWCPHSGNPLEIQQEPQKLEGWNYPMVKMHNPNLNRFWVTQPCDSLTDGRTDDSIWCAKYIILSRAKMSQMHENAPMWHEFWKKNLGGALAWPLPRPLAPAHSCPFCPTHFLVPSGAYDINYW